MSLKMNYRGRTVVAAAVVGVTVAVIGLITGAFASAAMFLAIEAFFLGLLLWMTRSGGEHPQLDHNAAQAAAGDDDVIVYWMPGCIYCDLLKRGLGSARHDVTWVNILEDAEAAKFVAAYHDGDETVPTAVTGSGEMLNPTPAAIKAQLVPAS